jgi:transcriptional regulator, MarR family
MSQLLKEENMDVKECVKLLHDIKILERKVVDIFEKKLGISLTRFQIIKYLYEVEVATPKQIAQILEIDAAAITRHLKKLEEGGYVRKKRNEDNNREVLVEITEFSKSKIDQCVKETDIRTLIDEEFTDDDFKQLEILLKKFNNNLK